MRLRPRSIRARDTLVAAVLALLVFGGVAVAIDLGIRSGTEARILQETQLAARRVSASVRDGTLTSPIPDDSGGRILIQVVGPGGRVLDSTPAAAGLPPLSTRWPTVQERVHDWVECDDDRCMMIEAIRVTTAPDSVVVYAGTPMPGFIASGLLEVLLGLGVLLLSALSAWVTWRIVGRTLRPVEAIRAQLAEISGSDLSRRVPEPAGDGEIAELARTANQTLDRLERAVERQRQFASDASHELRTPIAGLRANLEDAAMHPDDTDLDDAVRSALRDTDRLESIVTDLLLLARIGTGGTTAHEEIDLAALVGTEVRQRGSSLLVCTRLDPDAQVRGVRMQLVRLLGNLLDNAERYADKRVEIEVRSEASEAVLMVTDDGAGIDPGDRERIFERFTRLDSARSRGAGGTGLGLAIAREIAQAHGGVLDLEASPRGARFVLRLPLG
ncbi:sensor histidine kinase [Actinomadura sp. 6N118]|uniref:sensor histidine kinase n=1 Tax=Actinomadura sp. 6N118 TaxID=3375151 RepID=UPI0037B6D73D